MTPFTRDSLSTVNSWRAARGMRPLRPDALPKIGLMVEGLAAGFLFETESPEVAILDSFITNPEAPLRKRYRACQEILAALGKLAAEKGISRLVGFTDSRGVADMAARLGYESRPSRLVFREIA